MNRDVLIDLLGLAGMIAVCSGIWWCFPPAGLIASGSGAIVVAYLLQLGTNNEKVKANGIDAKPD